MKRSRLAGLARLSIRFPLLHGTVPKGDWAGKFYPHRLQVLCKARDAISYHTTLLLGIPLPGPTVRRSVSLALRSTATLGPLLLLTRFLRCSR
ncbi:hypothetical protein F5X96DRAFT_637993 [Biscogniauxia mediterranea]|nr:hypothetical protein F5X96DRAFT_637993 [Biscogniauxia mediterranea]